MSCQRPRLTLRLTLRRTLTLTLTPTPTLTLTLIVILTVTVTLTLILTLTLDLSVSLLLERASHGLLAIFDTSGLRNHLLLRPLLLHHQLHLSKIVRTHVSEWVSQS